MKFSSDVEFEQTGENPQDVLRMHERLFNWRGDDWHFKLLATLTPYQVYGFFGSGKLKGDTLYFNGATQRGKISFQYIKQHYRAAVYQALGNLEICLAKDGEILESFFTGSPKGREYCSKDEINLMFELSRKALSGQPVDAAAELENHRRQHAAQT